MKSSMSILDIMVCVRELKNAIGTRVENVYETEGKIILRLRSKDGRQDLVIEPGRRVNFTGRVYSVPKQPSSFAMLLRKHLSNSQVSAVDQPLFERILELRFSGAEEHLLIVEIFGGGNVVLCNTEGKIVQPYRTVVRKSRALKAGEIYKLPPKAGTDPRELDDAGFRAALKNAPDLVRGLAVNIGLGGQLAEEICARASVPREVKAADISEEGLESVLQAMKGIFAQEPAPCILYEDGRPADVLPFDFKINTGKEAKRFSNFNEALDEYFSTTIVIYRAERRKERFEEQLEKLLKRQAQQQEQFKESYTRASEVKRQADLTSINHALIEEILSRVEMLKKSEGWQEAAESVKRAKEAREPWAEPINSVDFNASKIEIVLAGQALELDTRKSSFENASRFYQEYKSLSEKAAGAKDALELTDRELEKLRREERPEVELAPPPRRRKPKWFEHYRWFVSSDGTLVIAGRDTQTNAEVVEKHMEPKDRYLHADIIGAPHVVVKTAGKEVTKATLQEAAEFAAMNSRAWREGLGSVDVFWAEPEQVTSKAPSGTYLPRGSYVIEGKRNLMRGIAIRATVGVVAVEGEQLFTCGPSSAMRKHSKLVIDLYPGPNKKSDLAHEIQSRFKAEGIEVSVDEVERATPPGAAEIR